MLPAFQTRSSLYSFCGLMTFLLLLPVITGALGHPPREQAYAGMSSESGPLGANIREIFHDPASADILFLGSSLLRAGLDLPMTEHSLSAHLGIRLMSRRSP